MMGSYGQELVLSPVADCATGLYTAELGLAVTPRLVHGYLHGTVRRPP